MTNCFGNTNFMEPITRLKGDLVFFLLSGLGGGEGGGCTKGGRFLLFCLFPMCS